MVVGISDEEDGKFRKDSMLLGTPIMDQENNQDVISSLEQQAQRFPSTNRSEI